MVANILLFSYFHFEIFQDLIQPLTPKNINLKNGVFIIVILMKLPMQAYKNLADLHISKKIFLGTIVESLLL